MKLLFCALLLGAFHFCFSQNDELGTWNMVNAKINLTHKWSIFSETQTRSQLFFNNFYYYEIKGGPGYAVNENFNLLAGVGRYMTYSNNGNFKKPIATKEFRTWLQVTMNQYLERIKFEHRYRIEQRWVNGDYRNRFRYRLSAYVPLKGKTLKPKSFYLVAFDEIFLTNQGPYFERNRIFGGGGYKFNNTFVLQPGYIYQFDNRADNTHSGKGFLQLSLFIELQHHKGTHEKLPSAVD